MYHCAKDYDAAIKWYYKSVVLSPYFSLSLFGLAQMYMNCNKLIMQKYVYNAYLKLMMIYIMSMIHMF